MAELICYNKGCKQTKFDPANNADDACLHHPGNPVFHDAYKGWSCCNKKTVDFTEFLNIKGCTYGKHSNVKPPEPEKPKNEEIPDVVETKVPAPIPEPRALKRPSYEVKRTRITPIVAPGLKKAIDALVPTSKKASAVASDSSEIPIGTMCKNSGCKVSYESPASNSTHCAYHPGTPIFHEGIKYWSCCKRKATDFTAFLNQVGCARGTHKWINEKDDSEEQVDCRYDWHQTASNVVVAIYAKMYDYKLSYVELNPVRLVTKLVFPQQENAEFNLDVELRGIIDVARAKVEMLGTKVEITLPKVEFGQWTKLVADKKQNKAKEEDRKSGDNIKSGEAKTTEKPEKAGNDSDVDLDDLQPLSACRISEVK